MTENDNIFNVRDFGASGDGRSSDTAAIQHAIDEVAKNGGGTVMFPPGTYLSGTLTLCSRCALHLQKKAVLKCVPTLESFPVESDKPSSRCSYFIRGDQLHDVIITGGGTIDGSVQSFWTRRFISDAEIKSVLDYNVYCPRPRLPIPVYLTACEFVTITDIRIENSANFTLWLIGCSDVSIHDVSIRTPRLAPNTDGIDIDCCRNVCISRCDISTGDDCIAVKSDPYRIGKFQPCENIEVEHCKLSTPCCAIRIGYEGAAPIRNCRFHHLTMTTCRHGIDIVSIAPDCDFLFSSGTAIEEIEFSEITMFDVGQPIFIWAGNEPPRRDFNGHICNISFRNITAQSVGGCYIGSAEKNNIYKLVFNKFAVMMNAAGEASRPASGQVPSHWGGAADVAGIYFRNISDINLKQITVEILQKDRPGIRWDNVDDFRLDNTAMCQSGIFQC